MSHRVAVAAHKGGSGKTTIAVNLAGCLAHHGHRVIVVDADPQGAATIGLGVVPSEPALYQVLLGAVPADQALRDTPTPGVRVLPATIDLAGAEVELPRRAGWQTTMRDRLRNLERSGDIVIIDTPPGLGVLSYMALSAADQVLVACPADFLAVRSLPMVLESIDQAGVELIGIVPSMVERRTRHEAEFLAYLETTYPERLLTPIPRRVVVRDAMAAGQPVIVFAPSSDASTAFDSLAQEVQRVTQTS